MMDLVLSREEVRSLDRQAIEQYGIPGAVLMENAGRGVAELMLRLGAKGKVTICCGKGNNGGDGLVIARHLDIASVPVQLLLFASPGELSGDAALNYRIVAKAGLPIRDFSQTPFDMTSFERELVSAEWIVDALFGTGLRGPVRPPFDQIINAVNQSGAQILAVDIPSGLDCDTGRPSGPTIRADDTATFVATKKGFINPEAAAWTGTVHVLGLGIPRSVLHSLPER